MQTNETKSESNTHNEPQKQHQWLHQLIGEWKYETEVTMGSEGTTETATGTESVRSLGGLWIIAEGQGEMPGCGRATTLMTVGYDSQKQRYVGTWIGSMMNNLWVYDGELDADERVLTLESEGPAMTGDGKMAMYRDAIAWQDRDRRVTKSSVLGDDGNWHQFMTVHYQRQK